MSAFERRRYVLQWLDVLSLRELGPLEKLVLLYLADRQQGTRPAWPKVDTIARELGTNRRQVFRALARLEAARELEVVRRTRRVSLYWVTRLSQPPATPEGDAESPYSDGESREGDAESPEGDAESPMSDGASPDPIRDPIRDPITNRGKGGERPRGRAQGATAGPPVSSETLRGELSEALARAWKEERGITLNPSAKQLGRLLAWAKRESSTDTVAAVDTVARAYLRKDDAMLADRGWPLAWLVDRAPKLWADARESSRPKASSTRELADKHERLARAEERYAREARERGDEELAAAHEASAKRHRHEGASVSEPREVAGRARRAARTAEVRSAL